MDFSINSRIIITCNKRLSPYLAKEVELLGFKPARVFQTGVELHGNVFDCIRLNLNLRCASQVLYSVRTFKASHADDVYATLIKFPWEKFLDTGSYVSITSNVDHPSVNNPLFVNVKVKDAMADRMRRETSQRPDSGPDLSGAVFHLYWKDRDAELFLDTSGETLAKHGYRKIPGKAPMLEALASGTLLASSWDRKSPFVNPMCGSGTVAIEAAMLATNRVPGLYRNNYSFMHVLGYEEAFYARELKRIREQVEEQTTIKIIATDLSEDAVNIATSNARAAGVDHMITFQQCDFQLTEIPEEPGVIFFNPEYGERLGEIAELEKTYSLIGDFMKKKCAGYTGYIFTGNLDLAKHIGLKPKRRIEFFSAKLDCRLLEYELYSGSREKS